jgi:hypothetical protein
MRHFLALALPIFVAAGLFMAVIVLTSSAQQSPTQIERLSQAIDRNTRASKEHTRAVQALERTVRASCR